MARVLYTAHAHVTGGREEGHGRSADGELDVRLRVPKEMGGVGGGTNPEELFAVGTRLASKARSARSPGAATWTPASSRSIRRSACSRPATGASGSP